MVQDLKPPFHRVSRGPQPGSATTCKVDKTVTLVQWIRFKLNLI